MMARSWIEGAFERFENGDDLISVWLFINSEVGDCVGGLDFIYIAFGELMHRNWVG